MKKLLLIIFVLSNHLIFATTRNVPMSYSTISSALSASQDDDTILVAPGTYSEDILWPDKSGLKLLSSGGSAITIIVGTQTGSVITMIQGPTSQIDSTTIIDGFQITNGRVDTVSASGGGLFLSEASPVLRNLDVNNNSVLSMTDSSFGGGIYVGFNSNPLIENCAIHDNQSFGEITTYGGGICINSNSNVIINNCEIFGNSATSNQNARGGGVAITDSAIVRISDCNIHHNINAAPGLSSGGGVYIFGNSNTIVVNSSLSDNLCDGPYADGGGIFIYQNTGFIIDNCRIENNLLNGPFDHSGGGVCCFSSQGQIFGSSISENVMEGDRFFRGAGIYTEYSEVLIQNSQIRSNSVIPDSTTIALGFGGGGFYCTSSNINFENCLVAENKIDTNAIHTDIGCGLFISGSYVKMDHCTVTDNEFINDTTSGAAIRVYGDSIKFINSIIWNPKCFKEIDTINIIVTIGNCDLRNGDTLNGNINSEPFFIGNGNYHLTQSSPCLNAGNFSSGLPYDLDGNPRPMPAGTYPDMGAYELDQIVGIENMEANSQSTVFPNPVYSDAIISLADYNDKIIQIDIYDDLGKLQFSEFSILKESYILNSEKLKCGIYFYKLTTRSGNLTKGKFVVN
ncbi:MAG: right-handed parallel beta-helix repeat-containing protein [Bacteroidetes bacterium]|nr:right-handed parallel beta-helix repeat-containing protein [Bacteroidota bacterium]MBP9790589.1 right-handed parallel beta-helix repeat-containing protein [Bacteroidia bacterium]